MDGEYNGLGLVEMTSILAFRSIHWNGTASLGDIHHELCKIFQAVMKKQTSNGQWIQDR